MVPPFLVCWIWRLIVDWKLVVTAAAAAGLGAVVGTLAVPSLGGVMPDRQLDSKMLEMSVGILREPARVDDDPIRSWAVKVMEKKSGVAFTDPQRTALMKRTGGGR
jgi:hypothetical protein